MSELFKDIPEFVETDIGESITARTETLADNSSGVEASSSASLAAYLNSLQFHIEESPAWFGKGNGWRVRTGTYWHEATPQLWQETYLSALLRAIRYADDASYRLAGYRKMDPITTIEGEQRFLKAAEDMFFSGWHLGSDPEVQVATIVSNHLTAGIIKYFADAYRLEQAANLFERIYQKEPEVAALLAQSYIGMMMNAALKSAPKSYPILLQQVDFLLSKGKAEWACQVAQQAVNSAPSEFLTWAKLSETHIELGQFDKALLTLNSCPMFTFNERDLHRMPPPARTHLPVKKFIAESGLIDEESARDNEADVALLRLPAPGLRGTFSKAYELLAKMVSQIGWDELLKTRSAVFVMEEEYRQHKSSASMDASGARNGDGDDENASTRAIHSPDSDDGISRATTPTIMVSHHDEDNETKDATDTNGDAKHDKPGDEKDDKDTKPTDAKADDDKEHAEHAEQAAAEQQQAEKKKVPHPALEKPEQLAHDSASDEEFEGSAFSNKRLCERWLDNLFLVLYEDLRVYTIWRAEISHFQTQHMSYRKTGTEWEILGELALRLHHKDEAKDAFQRCLDAKFSARSLLRLLDMYASDADLPRTLNAAIKLTAYHHRWYMESSYPSSIAHAIFTLGQVHGLAKIEYTLLSMNLPDGIFNLMMGYLTYGKKFNVEGSEY
ncbi:bud site selection-related protein [Trichosporon asahii var. asahii CBS 2479]|uniref:Bud site selection-related protein n=1 Tax=Trichosporon asahii var. asahii (strain ATCC 90039 / CBS 2479 / JCM 2466 / KCTC 7840 / NBRC 103889/ NCYC 2677 / UAMH 7654) TaxID=1186058 RepID=J6F2U8_TRIAS|nr:bud site selection-related protein [Trichosporon asahii var. asahii CBS 2479]EJT49502.1 bud site selection-related protein [Trichosporon asahii var. asahii CBS 2479]